MSCRKQLWSDHHSIRQKSSIDILLPTNNIREHKLVVLQKQSSVDASLSSTIAKQTCEKNISGHIWKDERPESSLRILAAVKKRPQGNGKNEQDLTERLKKALKDRGNRFNLNIFLGHSTNPQEPDAGSDPETPPESINFINKDVIQTEQSMQLTKNNNNIIANKHINGSFEQRRPPLVRAMSAPIRPLEDSAKILQGRKKLRRKKINLRDQEQIAEQSLEKEEPIQQKHQQSWQEQESILDDKTMGKIKNNKKIPRVRSAVGCDIVTLVSLLSSGGSDSEKEENLIIKNEIPKIRAPMLRKSGKSVSFQEKDFSSSSKELSTMFRRNSIAPVRLNRPPTAPIYSTNFENISDGTNSKEMSKKIMLKANSLENNDDNENLPDNVRSPKEKECWKLFQKMSKRGIAVSYDTILRGMLTPTELRIIQIQKEAEDLKIAQQEHE